MFFSFDAFSRPLIVISSGCHFCGYYVDYYGIQCYYRQISNVVRYCLKTAFSSACPSARNSAARGWGWPVTNASKWRHVFNQPYIRSNIVVCVLCPELIHIYLNCNIDALVTTSVLPRPFSKGGTPCPVLMTPCLFQEAEMTPCLFLVTPNDALLQFLFCHERHSPR